MGKVGEQLGPDRYLQVAYEDLVEKPLEVLSKVTNFTGSPLSNEMLEAVAVKMLGKTECDFVETKQTSEKNTTAATLTTEYYSTVRPKGHRHDKWRSKLDKEQVEVLQCGPCGEVLRKLGYQRLDHSDDT